MGKILYFDCLSGISGDMTLGALLDLGLDPKVFLDDLAKIDLKGYRVDIKRKSVQGISGTDVDVVLEDQDHGKDHHHFHRNLNDIERIIDGSDIPSEAKDLSKTIFDRIARAEAKIHDKPMTEVHFHEVGAIDSIVDIVGTALCIARLGVDKIYASPLHLGTGFVECAHGTLPVPAPATVEILKGVPVYSTGVRGELVTPTGAAIIRSLAEDFVPLPPMTIQKTGYGAGKKDYGIANLLRVLQGTEETAHGARVHQLLMLETNMDDMNPETYSYLVPLLLDKGALDVFLTSIIMKKGRPGTKLSLLCRPEDYREFEDILFTETTTLGVRKSTVDRNCLDRKIVAVETQFGPVKVKAAFRDGKLLKVAPEYEECKRIALKKMLPLKQVYDALAKETWDL
ncbi:MAG: nickel pincer cofactor biosynthesis protein LarC [Desulfobacterales bacterium]|nr:nickel pincer cofactor biosynthesis protein LarC [Desulfobacterales bacterium]